MGDHDHQEHDSGHGCCHDDDCCAHKEHEKQEHSHGNAETPAFDPVAFGGVDISGGDGGVFKKILVEGSDPVDGDSPATPPSGSNVKVHYVGTLLDGSKFDSSRDRPGFFETDIGVGRVIKGWDIGICSMKKGEKCILACRSDYAYGEHGSPPKIPGGATLLFEVELFSWKEKRKDKWQMTMTERYETAEKDKAQGTKLFKAGAFAEALETYVEAANYVEDDYEPPEDKAEASATLRTSCLLNGATCALKVEEFAQAAELCTKVLAEDTASVKAYFRRGTARMRMGEWAEAKADLRQASTLDPKSKEVRDAFKECAEKEAASKKSEKALYGKMFG